MSDADEWMSKSAYPFDDLEKRLVRTVWEASWNAAIVKAADLAFKRKSGYETGIDLLELKRESLNSEAADRD